MCEQNSLFSLEKKMIESAILSAIGKLKQNDGVLIEKKMEWACAHRMAVYLEASFPSWNIDCEYNKMGKESATKHNSQGEYKRPDIVIHKRERFERKNNLLMIEIKMESDDGSDERKLIDFTSAPNSERPFQYQYGLAIAFLPKLKLKWFQNGCEVF